MLANMESVSGFMTPCLKLQPTKPSAILSPRHQTQTQVPEVVPTAAHMELQESGAEGAAGVPEAPCWLTWNL